LVKYVSEWVDSFGLQVVVAGLSGDSERRPFGDILRLVPLADEFVQLTALCSLCKNGTVAQFSKYLGADVKNENQIAVGGLDRYVPVCRRHFS
jgi:thymidine kinase